MGKCNKSNCEIAQKTAIFFIKNREYDGKMQKDIDMAVTKCYPIGAIDCEMQSRNYKKQPAASTAIKRKQRKERTYVQQKNSASDPGCIR